MRSLLVRLLAVSLGVAVVSIAATTWLITRTTGETVRGAFEQTLEADSYVYQRLLAYAQGHATWDDVEATVAALSDEIGDRVAVTTSDGRVLADSADSEGRHEADLPPTPTAEVDARTTGMVSLDASFHVAGLTEEAAAAGYLPTGHGARFDSIAGGMAGVPVTWRLSEAELAAREEFADDASECLADVAVTTPDDTVASTDGLDTTVVVEARDCMPAELTKPSQAAVDLSRRMVEELSVCLDDKAIDYTITEDESGLSSVVPPDPIRFAAPAMMAFALPADGPSAPWDGVDAEPTTGTVDPKVEAYVSCVATAQDTALAEVVAEPALVYVGSNDRFDPLSGQGWAPVLTAGAGVLAVAGAVTVTTGRRLTRPIRTLTLAAHRMGSGDRAARVPVAGRDEVADLAHAFNAMAESIDTGEQHRRAMVSDIAHELRTPLSNVRGYLEAAEDGVVPIDQDLVTSLREESDLLRHLVEDLQSLALADAGALRMYTVDVDASDLVRQVVAAHGAAAADAGLALTAVVPPPESDADLTVCADPTRLRQALGNLVGNALRYTPHGGTIGVSVDRDGDDLVIAVTDDGPGIPPEHLDRIFDRFHRVEASRSRDTGGSGLGLPIARSLVQAHGGTLTVTSTEGQGSTFTITLPRTGVE